MPPKDGPRDSRGRAQWYQHMGAASIGLEIGIAIALCTLGGMWLQDNVTHWAPWTMLVGLGIGIGAASLSVTRVIKEHLARFPADGSDAPPAGEADPTTPAEGQGDDK